MPFDDLDIQHPDEDQSLYVFVKDGLIQISLQELAITNGIQLSLEETISVRDALSTFIKEQMGQ